MAKKIPVSSAKKNKKTADKMPGGISGTNDLLRSGMQAQNAGRLDEALAAYAAVLAAEPGNADAMLYSGTVAYLRRDFAVARKWLKQALAAHADAGSCYLHLGLVNDAEGEFAEALECHRQAVRFLPKQQQAHYNLGLTLVKMKRPAEAAEAFAAAARLAPADTEIVFQFACALLECGRAAESQPLFERFVRENPHDASGWTAFGIFQFRQNNTAAAAECFENALRIAPDDANAHYRYAAMLRTNKQYAAALPHFLRAHELAPGDLAYTVDYGYCQSLCGDIAGADATAQKAIALAPESHYPHLLMGYIWTRENAGKAVFHYERAVALNSQSEGEVAGKKALAQYFAGQICEAEENFQKAIALCPDNADNYMNYGNALMAQARIPECLENLGQALRLRPENYYAFSNVLLYSHYVPQATRADLWQLFQDYDRRYARPLRPEKSIFANPRDAARKLRVGFVSCDFRIHSVAFFVEPLFRSHDRRRFEFFAYASSAVKDKYTDLLRTYVENWRDILPLSDEQAAAQIRRDQIDILCDLGGHTSDNRLLVFARKPAPVQVSWLGFPDTTGLSAIDYRFSDEYADPSVSDAMSAEKVVRLPGGFHCYCPFANAPEIDPMPKARTGHITFGSFNNYAKTSTEIAALWVQILNQVPGSRLMLKSLGLADVQVQAAVRERFARLGLDPERLIISQRTASIHDHLKLYNEIDIALDTWPYNGTTTTFEALWMGVPLVSLVGATHASRVGASLLANCGLEELICQSPEEYVAKTAALAGHDDLRLRLRRQMRKRLRLSPLLSETYFTCKFQTALQGMWRVYCGETAAIEQMLHELPPFMPPPDAIADWQRLTAAEGQTASSAAPPASGNSPANNVYKEDFQ